MAPGLMRWRTYLSPVCAIQSKDEHLKDSGNISDVSKRPSLVLALAVNDELSVALQGWEMATMVMHGHRRLLTSLTLNLLDRRDGYPSREQVPLPTEPPYTAHIGNMSFGTTKGDVSQLFEHCDVTNIRIVEDMLEKRPKGFGYVEFATLDGLKKALTYAGSNLVGRTIRVSVADPRKPTPCQQFTSAISTYC